MNSNGGEFDTRNAVVNLASLDVDSAVIDEDEQLSDEDDCTEVELKDNFQTTYEKHLEQSITLDGNYILYLDYSDQRICVGLSNNTCEVHEITNNKIQKLATLNEHTKNIMDIKFNKINYNLIYTGSVDGSIKIWDLRSPEQSIHTITDTSVSSVEETKPFSCFDVSANDHLLCAGTDLYEGDSFLLFWDVRNTKSLGGYWESHMDDVTKVKFHPTNNDKLSSCSTDGLINVYDLTQTSEDDALAYSLNTELCVEQIIWYKRNEIDAIASVTHPSEIHLWDIEEGIPYANFNRESLMKTIKRKSAEHCYIVNMHVDESKEELMFLIGSNWHEGECVRGVNVVNRTIHPSFILNDNKQRIRASYYDPMRQVLLTGGELGLLTVWKQDDLGPSTSTLKSLTKKSKLHNKKPY